MNNHLFFECYRSFCLIIIYLYRSFRLANPRRLDKLIIRDEGGCTKHNPGIGDILFVKDLQVGKVVSKDFRCSLFGGHVSPRLGWVSSF